MLLGDCLLNQLCLNLRLLFSNKRKDIESFYECGRQYEEDMKVHFNQTCYDDIDLKNIFNYVLSGSNNPQCISALALLPSQKGN
jgi:hypothetical protein